MTPATSYLGLKLAHPFILGASPLTGNLDHVRRAEDGGCAAVVMHSLFEEEIARSTSDQLLKFPRVAQEFVAALGNLAGTTAIPLKPAEYLEQITRIKAAISVPVIASLNGAGSDGWEPYAHLIEQAGADALELNVYAFSTGIRDSSAAIEEHIERLVRRVKELVHIPVAVRLSPFFTAFGSLATRLEDAGADGLVLFNRFYQPDIDIDTLEPRPNLHLSSSGELLLRLRWLGILAEHLKVSLAVTGGVLEIADGIKAVLSGAHAVQMVSAVLQQGPQRFREMEQGLRAWMVRHRCDAIEEFRGTLNQRRFGNPGLFDRAGYFQVLKSWSGGAG
jgi:dihydroorotate dehydrogenase (fumarate)